MSRYPLLLLVLWPMLAFSEDLRRADGSILKADIVRAEPDGLVVQTDAGIEKIDFVLLSPELQKRFNYDRVKADEFRAKRVAAQQQVASQQLAKQMAAIRAQAAAVEEKQSQQPSPEEAARRLRIEQSVIFATASVEQGTTKGARVGLSVQTGHAAATGLDRDTRTTTSLGEGFVYGLEGASGESWQGKLFPAGYYHYVDSFGEEQTMHAYALTVEDAIAHGADGRGPTTPSVDPSLQRRLPGNLQGGTLLESGRK
jgi:hypothetical protein